MTAAFWVDGRAIFDTLSFGSQGGGGGSVPLPSSLALALLGLVLVGGAARRRNAPRA